MKRMQRILSLLLTLCMVISMVPAQPIVTKAAESETQSLVKEFRFYPDSNGDTFILLDEADSKTNVTFNLTDNAYKFEILFQDTTDIKHVYVTSTVNGVKKKLDALFHPGTGCYETQGYFDPEDICYIPKNIQVEYTLHSTVPQVGSDVDWDAIIGLMAGTGLENLTADNTTQGTVNSGTIDLSGLEKLKNVAVEYVFQTFDDTTEIDLQEARSYYQAGANIVSYAVPGVNDSKYYIYLDMSDPNTYKMFLDDGLNAASKAIEYKMTFLDTSSNSFLKMEEVADAISNVSTVTDVIMDQYNIHADMENIREEITAADYIEDKEAVLEQVDQLEADKAVFTLLVTLLPAAAMGGPAGVAAGLFTGMFSALSSASDSIFDLRLSGILGGGTAAKMQSNKIMERINDNVVYYYDQKSKVITYVGSGVLDSYGAHGVVIVDGKGISVHPVEAIVSSGITVLNNYTLQFVERCTIPDTVWYVGYRVFHGYRGEEIVLHEGVKEIHEPFSRSSSLKTVYLPSTLVKARGLATECTALTDVYYNGTTDEFERIDRYESIAAFYPKYYFSNPYKVHTQNFGKIGDNLTWSYDEETETLTISGEGPMEEVPYYEGGYENGLSYSEAKALDWLKYPWRSVAGYAKHLVVEEGVTSLANYAFRRHPALETVKLPGSLTAIGEKAFEECKSLEKVEFTHVYEKGAGLGGIPRYCFNDCTALRYVKLPEGLRSIGYEAFYGCSSLESIVFPSTFSSTYQSFGECPSLQYMWFLGDEPSLSEFINTSLSAVCYYPAGNDTWRPEKLATCDESLIWVPYEHGHAFGNDGICECGAIEGGFGDGLTWRLETNGTMVITGKGTVIEDYSSGNTPWAAVSDKIKKVAILDGVTSIGSYAFSGLKQLENIRLPETLQEIKNYAFSGDKKLTSLELPKNLKGIGSNAFRDCTALTSIIIPEEVFSILDAAFAGCTNVTEIKFTGNAPTISSDALEGITANAYYPAVNSTWTADMMQNYGGSLTWKIYCPQAHTEERTPGKKNTCTEDGLTETIICSVCGEVLQEQTVIKATGHAWSTGKQISCPSETTLGKIRYTCSFCNEIRDEEDPTADHVWGKSIQMSAPTETSPGYTKYICTRCYEHKIVEVPALNGHTHEEVITPGKEPTCTEWGWTEGSKCAICNDVITYQNALEPLGHELGDWVTEGSLSYRACTRCGYTENKVATEAGQVEILAPQQEGLTFAVNSVETSEDAYKTAQNAVDTLPEKNQVIQKVFDITLKNVSGEAVQPEDAVTVKLPLAANESGNFSVFRINGDNSLTDMAAVREGDFLVFQADHFSLYVITNGEGHVHSYQAAVTAPTCAAGGYTTYTCACGHSYQDNKVAASGHKYDDNVDGTCNVCSVNRETVETRQVTHMFRMYNPNTGEHFYTGSEEEKGNLVAVGWQYEGVGFTFPANTGAPVHRLFQPSTGEHLYTMDEEEKATLMADGWNYEGIAFNSAYDTEAIQHRLHNPNATVGAYHFTFSDEERQNLINVGWEYQGIGWYSCWK